MNESINDIGMAFATGCIWGTIYNFSYGCIKASKGWNIITAFKLIRDRSSHLGGCIALWNGIFLFSNGILCYKRQKEDRYNLIFGWFITGLLSIANLARGQMKGF